MKNNYSNDELKYIVNNTSTVKKTQEDGDSLINVTTRNNALALYMDMNLTRRRYNMLRKYNKKVSNEKFFSYNELLIGKKIIIRQTL